MNKMTLLKRHFVVYINRRNSKKISLKKYFKKIYKK